MPPRPRLDARQTDYALQAYIAAREQTVRYVLSVLDPTAFDAPALPYPEVLVRVQELIAIEIGYYLPEAMTPPEGNAPRDEAHEQAQEEQSHG